MSLMIASSFTWIWFHHLQSRCQFEGMKERRLGFSLSGYVGYFIDLVFLGLNLQVCLVHSGAISRGPC